MAPLALAAALVSPATHATAINQTFDTDPVLNDTQAPGTWYTDRFAPAAFESAVFDGDSRLRQGISAADGANNRPSAFSSGFYNTQGRKFDIFAGTGSTMGIDLFIPTEWQTTGRRMAGMWGTTTDASGSISGFPIIEFASDGPSGARFQIFSQDTDQDTTNGFSAGFIELGLPTDFAFDEWYRLETELTENAFNFSIFGATGSSSEVLSFSDSVTFSSTQIDNVILQGHNTTAGVDYDIYWDNFRVNTVPVPGSVALLALGLAGMGWVGRRRAA